MREERDIQTEKQRDRQREKARETETDSQRGRRTETYTDYYKRIDEEKRKEGRTDKY